MKLEILPVKKVEPEFRLTLYYMIGDADGDKEFYLSFSELWDELIKLIRILKKLDGYSPKGHWGFIFDEHHLEHALEEGVLTEDEVKFLDWTESDSWDDFLCEVIRDSYCDEREFLVYEGFDITYIDEDGVEHPVNIIDEV